jgi:hypothetical protein
MQQPNFYTLLVLCLMLSSCGQDPRVDISVQNRSSSPVSDLIFYNTAESTYVGDVQAGEAIDHIWKLQNEVVSEGAFMMSFVLPTADTVSQGFAYYARGMIDLESVVVSVTDSTYTLAFEERGGLGGQDQKTEQVRSIRTDSLLSSYVVIGDSTYRH